MDILQELEEQSLSGDTLEPFYKVDAKDAKEKHQWLKKVKEALLQQASSRSSTQKTNYSYYLGADILQDRRSNSNYPEPTRRLNSVKRIVVNHLHDLTETRVSQMTRIKPAVQVIPSNDEWADRASAITAKAVMDHLWYINNVDYIMQRMHRTARITGESYCFVEWDKNKGDLDPAYVEARDAGVKEIPLEDGSILKVDKPIKVGDITYELEMPWRVLLQRKLKIEDVEYYIRIKIIETEKLKDQYPDKHAFIKKSDSLSAFDMESGQERMLENHTVVFEFTHLKCSDTLPEGKRILFTDHGILEEGKHPFEHGKFTFVRLTDLDVDDVLNGVSRYRFILPLQNAYTNLTTLIAKNIYLMAHAKWMMPRGAARIEQLGNDNTIVQYQGSVPPTLVTTNPNPKEVYDFRAMIKDEMQVIYGSHGISRGEIPKGITAASALQFLNELESERASTDIAKHSFMVKDLALLTLAVTGEKYQPDDGRLVRIVGEGNKYFIRAFDSAHMSKPYDVRVEVSTSLPDSKSAKIQRTLDAMQRHPEMLTSERWADLLELGEDRKAISLIAEATRAADSENEDILSERPVRPPEEYEDHIQHWLSHSAVMQQRTFKEDVAPEIQEAFIEHLFMTEKLMMAKAASNPTFQAQLSTLKLFPIFTHKDALTPVSAEHAAVLAQGQANRGEPVTALVPGQPMEAQSNAPVNLTRR